MERRIEGSGGTGMSEAIIIISIKHTSISTVSLRFIVPSHGYGKGISSGKRHTPRVDIILHARFLRVQQGALATEI